MKLLVDTQPLLWAAPLHRDPLDRLPLAQVLAEGITLLTGDTQLARYLRAGAQSVGNRGALKQISGEGRRGTTDEGMVMGSSASDRLRARVFGIRHPFEKPGEA